MTMRKRRFQQSQNDKNSSPEWMLTYSDMVTLLLAFFILMYAYSIVDVQRFQAALSSIQVSLGGGEGVLDKSPFLSDPEGVTPNAPSQREEIIRTYEAVRQYLEMQGLEGYISPRLEERGVILEIENSILFDPGRADIKAEAKKILQKVTGIIKSVPNQIIVEGHTDNVPMNTQRYPSNWELSVDRAVRVVRYFIEEQHLRPERFLATGYSEYHPVSSNDTASGRAKNRRVNIVISQVNLLDKGAEELDGKE
ncbi:MAG: OmpA family protein [Firmicutes bacterium]|jgi:chemotaxis protein MotB|nr:OmpA family protein [Bacillota bacterium]